MAHKIPPSYSQFDVQIKGMRELHGPDDDGFRVFAIDDVPMLDLDNHAMFKLLTTSGVEETIAAAAIDKMSEFIHTDTIARLIAKRMKR